ncbi:endonuclease V [Psychroserpens mesophilus]|uniref:endonuclease V n=1 Tax=Psychroserpens mesophilus TaxID=325473 RepID=UPI003D656907
MDTLVSYQVAFDVHYYNDFAVVGYVIFENELSSKPYKIGQVKCNTIEPYVSGQFYKRELPCLLKALAEINENINLIYIDANVWLGYKQKGLGKYLFDAINKSIPIIGVSKSSFNKQTELIKPVLRGESKNPLFISSIGIELETACEKIKKLEGEFRIPRMIKLADSVCREHYS